MTSDIAPHVRGYVAVFGALLVLTLATVAISSLRLPAAPTIAGGLTIASVKVALVVLFFIHLKGERPLVVWPLALTAFLFAALLPFILWSEADHIVAATNSRLPTEMACSVCFGEVGPLIRESMNLGIFVLLGVTVGVLTCFARFFVVLARRARAAADLGMGRESFVENTHAAPLSAEGILHK